MGLIVSNRQFEIISEEFCDIKFVSEVILDVYETYSWKDTEIPAVRDILDDDVIENFYYEIVSFVEYDDLSYSSKIEEDDKWDDFWEKMGIHGGSIDRDFTQILNSANLFLLDEQKKYHNFPFGQVW